MNNEYPSPFVRRYSGQEMHWDAFIIKAINFQDPIKGEMSNDHGTARMSKLTRFLFPGALNLWITRIEWDQHLRQWLHPHKKGNTPPPDISWLSIFSIVKFFPMIFCFSILQKRICITNKKDPHWVFETWFREIDFS